jgi:hypothetical protein
LSRSKVVVSMGVFLAVLKKMRKVY